MEVLPGAVVVPVAAVQRGPKGAYVFVVQADQTVELRPVEVGPGEGDEIAIASGLVGGEVVVTDGVDKIADKTKVAVRTAGATPAPAAPPKAKPGP